MTHRVIMPVFAALLLADAVPPQVVSPVGRRTTQTMKIEGCHGQAGCTAVDINGSISASTSGRATAAAPTYVEGTDNPLSIDLSGNIRTLATATTAAKATAADPTYTEGSTSPISQDLSGHLRTSVNNFPSSQAVTGTFWQATQPVSIASMPSTPVTGTFWQATQPVSGTVAVSNAFALDTSVNGILLSQASTTSGQKGPLAQCAVTTAAPTYTTAQTDPLSCTTAGLLRVDGSGVTQPISGTVTANQGGTWTVQPGNTANTTAWKVDGSAVTQPVSGTVAVSNAFALDTSVNGLLLSQGSTTSGQKGPLMLAAVNNAAPVYVDGQTSPLTMNLAGDLRTRTDIAKVAGTLTVNGGLAGTLAVGGTQANNAAITANPVLNGLEALSTQPTAATTGNIRRMSGGLDGALYVRPFTQQWSCGLTAIGATLTQCQAAPAAGLKLYVTDVIAISDTTTAGQITLRYGTGTNCATGVTTLYPNVASITTGKWPYPANTAANPMYYSFTTPLAPAAANAVCAICVATNTCTITLTGYTAP